jgi:copper(I)-binding protein
VQEAVLAGMKKYSDIRVPGARVVRLSGGHHLVFMSNEVEVLREMRAFVASLK